MEAVEERKKVENEEERKNGSGRRRGTKPQYLGRGRLTISGSGACVSGRRTLPGWRGAAGVERRADRSLRPGCLLL
ncbi:hypothetical protein E2C01_073695 [Portunus trituberculatus]|uniref:Uncharacterized protein n=1 Tax=Portunus trituberculatus TaxID=210409 RepID=A0A5B7I1E2_PORTR|nr:hypothetical protein [Portunus trituberculatus]